MTPEANRNNVANRIIFTVGDILNRARPPGTFLSCALRQGSNATGVAAVEAAPAVLPPAPPKLPPLQRRCATWRGDGGWPRRTWRKGHPKDSTYRALTRCTRTWHLVPRRRISHAMRFRSIKGVSEIELDDGRLEQMQARNWWRRSVSISPTKSSLLGI